MTPGTPRLGRPSSVAGAKTGGRTTLPLATSASGAAWGSNRGSSTPTGKSPTARSFDGQAPFQSSLLPSLAPAQWAVNRRLNSAIIRRNTAPENYRCKLGCQRSMIITGTGSCILESPSESQAMNRKYRHNPDQTSKHHSGRGQWKPRRTRMPCKKELYLLACHVLVDLYWAFHA